MNSKNKLFNLGLTLFLILMHSLSFAQTFKYALPNFSITLPPLSESNRFQTSPLPYYTLFIETGNGRYYKNDSVHYLGNGEYAIPPYNIPYNYNILSGSEAILKLIGHYDTIKPPKSLYAYRDGFINTTPNQPPNQNKLATGQRIGFDYSDKVVIPGDTMTVVLTYKPENNASYVVAFFYNDDNPITGESVFSAINNPDQEYTFTKAYDNINSSLSIKAIRVKGGTAYISSTGIPPQVSPYLSTAQGNFRNAIYFMIPSVATSEERNIFISMAALKYNQIGTTTAIKAVLIKYDLLSIKNTVMEPPAIDTLEIGQFATDPNGIRTTPNCLSVFSGEPFSKPIKYLINFQNDGKGDAPKVEVTVWVPKGIELPPSGLLNVNSTISRKTILFVKKGTPQTKSPNTYELVTSGGERKIIFTMPNIKLPGKSNPVNGKDVVSRRGDISFTLNTIPKKSRDFTNSTIPACMYSDVSIVFFSNPGNELRPNRPVSAYDLIKKNCPYSAPCKRTYTAILPPPWL